MNLQNPIWIAGDIREALYVQFTRRLSELLEATQPDDVLTVFINSPGGDVNATLGIYDLLYGCGRKTVGIVAGRAESGASVILQACQKRVMTSNSALMLHRTTVEIKGTIDNVQASLDRFRRADERIYAIYASRCSANSAGIEKMAYQDAHFSPDEALAAGLIDEVW